MIKQNRAKNAIKTALIGLLIAEVIIDFALAIIYYRNGSYISYGVGAVCGLFFWIPIPVITAVIVTEKTEKAETA